MKKIALGLAIVAVGAALVALNLVRQLHAEREITHALQVRVVELERHATRPTTSVATTTPSPSSPFSSVATPVAVAPPTTTTGSIVDTPALSVSVDGTNFRDTIAAGLEQQRAMLRDPEYREALLQQQKMLAMQANPDFARDLDLTAEQAERLYTTLAEQMVRSMETQEPPPDPTDPASLQESQRKYTEQLEASRAELKKALGEAKFRDFEEYQSMMGARGEASMLRQSLASAGVPLTDDLLKPLTRILHEQQMKQMRENTTTFASADGQMMITQSNFVGQPGEFTALESQQAYLDSMAKTQRQRREALARVLSPQQLKVIEDQQEADLQVQRAQLRIMQTQQAAGKN